MEKSNPWPAVVVIAIIILLLLTYHFLLPPPVSPLCLRDIAMLMRSSIIKYSPTTTTTFDVRFIPLATAAATVSIASLSYHFLCGT